MSAERAEPVGGGAAAGGAGRLVVAGHLRLDPADRDAHIAASAASVEEARAADGCLDFAVSADPVDPGRVNVFECWVSEAHLDAFRASGDPDDEGGPDFSRISDFAIDRWTVVATEAD